MSSTQKILAQVVGAVLTLTGVVGFFAGDMLIVFGLNIPHNLVHLATGLLGLAAGFYASGKWSRDYNRWLGVVYILVAALGFVAPALTADLLAINFADNLLHLTLGLVLAGVGFGLSERAKATA